MKPTAYQRQLPLADLQLIAMCELQNQPNDQLIRLHRRGRGANMLEPVEAIAGQHGQRS